MTKEITAANGVTYKIANDLLIIEKNGQRKEFELRLWQGDVIRGKMSRFVQTQIRRAGADPSNFAYCGVPIHVDAADMVQEYFDEKWAAREAAEQAKTKNIAGLDELRAARKAENEYAEAFDRMMEDGGNDGANPPAKPQVSSQELAEKYPLAAIYLKADGYTMAGNHHKSAAGRKAMELIENGGSAEEAEAVLDNWLPESAMWE